MKWENTSFLERHVHKHLVTYLETRDPLQSGFRCKHSCNTALARLTDSWLSAINRSDLSGDVFLDFKKKKRKKKKKEKKKKNKSIRSCWSQNLTLKAFYLNSWNSLLFVVVVVVAFFPFCSYLNNRVKRVFIRGSYSSERTVKYGVPQGSLLRPVFFCIYVNDLPLHIPSNYAECHMLADDTTLHTTGKSVVKNQKTLQLCLDRISVWGQGLAYVKLTHPSLDRPSGNPSLKIWSRVFLFLVLNVICTNICLRITFCQIWTDLFNHTFA